MSFFPDGQPRIPNQTPVPPVPRLSDSRSDAPVDPTSDARPDGYPSPTVGGYGTSEPAGQGPYRVVPESGGRRRSTHQWWISTIWTVVILGVAVVMFSRSGSLSSPIVVVMFLAIAATQLAAVAARHRRALRARTAAAAPAADPPPPVTVDAGFWPGTQDAPSSEFSMPVTDVFSITGRGTVVTGQVEHGRLQVGQTISVLREGRLIRQSRVAAIEAFRQQLAVAEPGANVGLLLEGVTREDVSRGDVVVL